MLDCNCAAMGCNSSQRDARKNASKRSSTVALGLMLVHMTQARSGGYSAPKAWRRRWQLRRPGPNLRLPPPSSWKARAGQGEGGWEGAGCGVGGGPALHIMESTETGFCSPLFVKPTP